MSRRKAESIHVPADRAEAEEMLAEYVALERKQMAARLITQTVIDAAKEELSDRLRELETERKGLFAGLKAFWEAGGAKELAGRNRSADVNGAKIGIRKPPPSLKFPRGVKAADIVAWLGSLRLAGKAKWMRTPKTQLDKQAVIKTMGEGGSYAEMFEKKGLTLDQTDEFFIDAGLDEEAMKKEITDAV